MFNNCATPLTMPVAPISYGAGYGNGNSGFGFVQTLRCLNLSNSVAVAAYEVLRQQGFNGFDKVGRLGK